jgi:uncharacterized membrane protein
VSVAEKSAGQRSELSPRGPGPAESERRPLSPATALRSYGAQVGAITLAGLLGRILFLDHQPLWRDEAFTAIVVQRPIGAMLDAVRIDSAPPLAYLLNQFIAPLWSGPAGLRLVSAVAGAGAIPLGAALGRRIAGNRGGVISAVLCAIAPALLLSARDARMYALATTLVLATTLLLWRAVERPSLMRWVLYAGATTLALYTNYFAALAVVAQLLAVAVVLRSGWRRTASAVIAAAPGPILLIPWLIAARAQFAHASNFFWVPPVGFRTVGGEMLQFLSGPPVVGWVPDKPLLWTLQGFAVTAGVVAAFAVILLRQRLPAAGRRAALFCAVCGVGALLLFLVISLWRPLVEGRYASVVWGPLFPLLATGLILIGARRVIAAALFATLVASVALVVAVARPDTPAAALWLHQHVGANDLVDAYPSQYLLLLYYGDPALLAHTHVVSSSVEWFWGTAAYPPGAVIAGVPAAVTASSGTIYQVSQPDDPPAPSGYEGGYQARASYCWTGVCVTTYTR